MNKMMLTPNKLSNFVKKTCSFCKKITYEESVEIIFDKKQIAVTFCKNCNNKEDEEKAIICLGEIIKNNPDKNVLEILKKMDMNVDE